MRLLPAIRPHLTRPLILAAALGSQFPTASGQDTSAPTQQDPVAATLASAPVLVLKAAPLGTDFAPSAEFLDVDGITTHFVARGESGPAIVLIHGFGANTFTWRKTLDGLADRFRVVAVDLKGFGLTEKPRDGEYNIRAYARHLRGVIDAMDLERPVLVGNSMGGAVALHLAQTDPGRVAGLVLVDSAMPDFRLRRFDLEPGAGAAGGVAPAPEEPRAGRRGLLDLRPSPAVLRLLITRAMIERGLKSSYRDPTVVTPEMVDAYYLPTTIDGAMEALAAMMSPPRDAEGEGEFTPLPPLESLRVPTVVVWGRHDRVLPIAMADEFIRRIPGATGVVFEDAGHLPHEEEPEAFNALLARFALDLD